MRWWSYTLIGLFGYLVFMMANIPARQALGWLESANLPVTLQEISGTVWSGRAGQTIYKNNGLGAADWSFEPLGLLRGKLEYRVALRDQGQELKGRIAGSPLGDKIQLHDVTGLVDLNILLKILEQSYVNARGRLDLDLHEVEFTTDRLVYADGQIHWLEAGLNSPIPLELGGLQFDLSTQGEKVSARIKDLKGPVKIAADLDLQPDGQYLIKGQIKQEGAENQSISGLLRTVGKPLPDGSIQVDYKGQL